MSTVHRTMLGNEGKQVAISMAAGIAMAGPGIPLAMLASLALAGLMLYPLVGDVAWSPLVSFFVQLPHGPGQLIAILATVSATLLILASLWNKCETQDGGSRLLVWSMRRCWPAMFSAPTPNESRVTGESTCALQARVACHRTQDALIVSAGITTVARALE